MKSSFFIGVSVNISEVFSVTVDAVWLMQCVPLATEPGIFLIIYRVATIRRTTDTHYRHTLQTHTADTHYRHTLQTHTADTFLFFLTQRTYSYSNFFAISSLVLELLTL